MRLQTLRLTMALAAALAAASPWATAQTAPATGAKPAIADFFKDPQMRSPRLSPDGKYMATVVRGKGDNGVLAVIEIDNPRNVKVVAGFGDASIGSFQWVNDERLVYTATDTEKGNERDLHGGGLWSVKRDGSDERMLIQSKWGQQSETGTRLAVRTLEPDWYLYAVPQDGSSEVVVANSRGDTKGNLVGVRLARLNVETSLRRFIDEGAPNNTVSWGLDVNGQPWSLMTMRENDIATYVKDVDGKWALLEQGTQTEPPASPALSDGQDLRLIAGRRGGDDALALYRMDPASRKIDTQALISAKGFDIDASLVYDRASKRVLGIDFDTDAPGSVWFDPKLKAWQASVDKLLPGRANLLQCGACLTNSRLLVVSVSDVQPAEFYLYDGAANKLMLLGGSRPWIKASEMGHRDLVRIKARDGMEIPVMVTLPRGKTGPRPAVVLVHGGPWVKGTSWTWTPAAQFLASRGYVVIEPEFRGSEGYGYKLFRAGWKQWGLTMQDDVSDSLKWAVGKGWVDPQRVCIAGASYGGYATLMGMIKDPAQYKCGISWVGVTDIDLLFDIHWSDSSDSSKKYGMKSLVGDQVADAEQFRRTSPVKRAAELKQPLLLAYGGSDVRVPLKHGTAFRSAVEAGGNKNVDWVVYPDEGHGWRQLANNEDFWGRVERLLAKTIGTEPSPAAAAPASATGGQ
ncbi:MAG: S9 family peptidase [Mitsuaria chitosanitabida]|uniref:alpha/beta hydrolase family protein n=1 Tax=Roseateles chitosanitabidus TaxID=65048 RepID=UPI001B27B46A|nr:prolyl oligopeptidase family serine peptidase [Roseateles chitosanitabidus]MBO9686586.1 S9 family peptidase [Roseateles chitosanitabidus]